MSYQLHYAAKFEVDYAGGYFNWQTEEANQFLEELSFATIDESRTALEIAKPALAAKVAELRAEYTAKALETHPLLKRCTYGMVLAILEEILSGTTGDTVHLEWF